MRGPEPDNGAPASKSGATSVGATLRIVVRSVLAQGLVQRLIGFDEMFDAQTLASEEVFEIRLDVESLVGPQSRSPVQIEG